MATRRRKRQTPIALLWTRRDQLRFTETYEKLVGLAHQLDLVVLDLERKLMALDQKQSRRRRPPAVSDTPPANGSAKEE